MASRGGWKGGVGTVPVLDVVGIFVTVSSECTTNQPGCGGLDV